MRVSERLNTHIYYLVICLLCCGLKIYLPPEPLFGNIYRYTRPSSSFFFFKFLVLLRHNSHKIKFINLNTENTTTSTSNFKTILPPTKEIPHLLEIMPLILSPIILGKFKPNFCLYAKSLQPCLTLCDPVDCSPPGSSVHGDSPGKNNGVDCFGLLQGIFTTQVSNLCLLCLLHWQTGSLPQVPPGKY